MSYRTSLAIIATVIVGSMALLAGLAYGAPAASVQNDQDDDGGNQKGAKFEFGLIGDTRYTPEQREKFPNLMAEMNGEKLAFVVHDGDIKGGSSPCVDSIYYETRDLFNQFAAPLIYTPGDNEWTDCHRAGGDPLERLAFLRGVFFPDNKSLGQRKMSLTRQSAEYPENARWRHGNVVFATLHVVGSNNNLGRAPEADQEYAARNAANLEWLAEAFEVARDKKAAAVMFIIQANTFDEDPANLTGFADTLAALEQETIAFGKPVMLVHGDSHYFRMDKPMIGSASGRRLENLTRLETFGTDDVHWVRVSVDPRYDQVFTVRQEMVEANLVDQTP